MQQSMVKQACEYYISGNYISALRIYEKLARLLGRQFFEYNIALCKKKLGIVYSEKAKGYALRVACIMDDFTFQCYEPECELFPLTPQCVIQELEEFQPDLFFVESAWRGKDALWDRKISSLSKELKSALEWCQNRGVPTVFWNKEDPVHFGTFLSTAKHFDYVLTTDIDSITHYKSALGHDHVYLLPFACQPRIHNPIEFYARKDAFCFAGSYYVRYPERIRDLEDFLAELPQYKPLEIFDRNYGSDDVGYQFPDKYKPYIVGTLPFSEIDKAYKGYQYAINLNSIKHSQSMFARRVYELLGSNTIVISNYSRGIRVIFGDLVIASDSGREIINRIKILDDENSKKLRLLGLRKVMMEHTYERRLSFIAKHCLQYFKQDPLPSIAAVAAVSTQEDVRWILECYHQQTYNKKRLLLLLSDGVDKASIVIPGDTAITVLSYAEASQASFSAYTFEDEWLAVLSVHDYYGPSYFLDLAIATLYSSSPLVGKAVHYQYESGNINYPHSETTYTMHEYLPARCSLIRRKQVSSSSSLYEIAEQAISSGWQCPGLSIDIFNYCMNGRYCIDMDKMQVRVNDLSINTGIDIDTLIDTSYKIKKSTFEDESEKYAPQWTGAYLAQLFAGCRHPKISITRIPEGMRIQSTLEDTAHDYIYVPTFFSIDEIPFKQEIESILVADCELAVQYTIIFFDAAKEKLGHAILNSNLNSTTYVPAEASFIRFGLRISGQGSAVIKTLLWRHRIFDLGVYIPNNPTLLVTNNYPDYNQLYRNTFVHTRVKAYANNNVGVDVFRCHNKSVSYHEFNGAEVTTGNVDVLQKILELGCYQTILVHVLSQEMWDVLKKFPNLKVLIWIHGAEIQSWHRRQFNYINEFELAKAKSASEQRTNFWRELISTLPPNIHFVFVSKYLADTTMEDLGVVLDKKSYTVIHNPIDTSLFAYQSKDVAQRKKILSIRPYASRVYANDLTVKAIELLAEKPFFKELEFRIIGDGPLFDSTLAPLAKFDNVIIEKQFLPRQKIATLHQEYGVFLCPSRSDTQGVSRDEAMASGLVPITNAVAAIPEFVDSECGILAPEEDAQGLAEGIQFLYENPNTFQKISYAASSRVKKQSAQSKVIAQELSLFCEEKNEKLKHKKVTVEFSPEKTQENMPQSLLPITFISIDVEALPGRASADHVNRLMWGKFGNEEYGIGRICSILNEYGLKGNFMLDLSACSLYDDNSVARVGEFILKQGHELHAHLHSECLVRKWKIPYYDERIPAFSVLNEKLNYQLMEHTFFKFRQLFGFDPVAFRAGGYLINEHTVEAACASGFKVLSNIRVQHQKGFISFQEDNIGAELFRWPNGLMEIPVDFSIDPAICTFKAYRNLFEQCVTQKEVKLINLVNHSWTLLRRENELHETFDPLYEDNYRQICDHIKQNTVSKGYAEFLADSKPLAPLDSSQITFTSDIVTVSLQNMAECNICGAMFERQNTDICPGCSSRARHRQIKDILNRMANPFEGKRVLATHATSLEKEFLLSKVKEVINFDVRPVADIEMDIQDMNPIQSSSFDCFLAIHVLNHVKDDVQALKEIHRVLKPGGIVFLTIPYRLGENTAPYPDITEHYGVDAFEKYGVGSFRRYGLRDAEELFSTFFKVHMETGYDTVTKSEMDIFLLTKEYL